MRAMLFRDNQLELTELERPRPGPGQVLAKVRACGICGSDLHFVRYAAQMIAAGRASNGGVGSTIDLQRGVVMGHEFVAEVVEAGPGAEQWERGTRVLSMPVLIDPAAPRGHHGIGYSSEYPGAYGEYVVMSASLLLPVPLHVTDEVAATTEPCAVGLHALREAQLQPGESALVMGAGPIGLMTLLWLKHAGVRHVTVTELAAPRRELAKQLGADQVMNPSEHDVATRFAEAAGGPPDVVFECVGAEGTLQQAMELVKSRGRVLVVGVCMTDDTIKPLVGINKQLTLRFVLGYTPQEVQESLASIGNGSIDPSPLITRTVSLDELPAAFRSLSDPNDCKVVLSFRA